MWSSKLSVSLVVLICWMLPTPARAERRVSYQAQTGDSLWKLAQRSGCSVERVKEANDLRGDLIRMGDTLTLPNCKAG